MSLNMGDWRAQIGENSARLAMTWGTVSSTGIGTALHPDSLLFGLAFTDLPGWSYGLELVDFDDSPDSNHFGAIQSTGFVHEWIRDGNGLYVGANVGISITGDDFDETTEAIHHFTFCGISIKFVLGKSRDV